MAGSRGAPRVPHPIPGLRSRLRFQPPLCQSSPGTPPAPGVAHGQHATRRPGTTPRAPLTSLRCPAGARWDTQTGVIAEARLKELTPAMPVVFIKAIPVHPQKKFLISGVTIFTHSFTCRLGCSKVADDTTPEHR